MSDTSMSLNRAVRLVATAIAVSMSLYHLYIAFVGPPQPLFFRGTHLLFAFTLIFLLFPTFRRTDERPSVIDLVLIVLTAVSIGYLWVYHDYLLDRFVFVDRPYPSDIVLGLIFTALVLEGTRRVIGLALPITALLFLGYAYFIAGERVGSIVEIMYMTTEGIFGIPVSVSATYVILFILFGAFVERVGAGKLFMDFALALAGHTTGGPAKVACMTSAMFGTVSGSAVANVMTTGTFTIPLMKGLGYRPGFSGAVEAVASTGGQIMPPIMGAAAFVMAEFLGVSYLTVATYALIPAVLYFFAVFVAVHLEAKRSGLRGLPKADLPRAGQVLRERGHLFLPLVIIIGVLVSGYSAPYAALCGIMSTIPVAMLRESTRRDLSWRTIIDGLDAGARNSLSVAAACACAGIVIGVIAMTGLGLRFTSFVLLAAQNSLIPALVLTMLAGIILGMGLPTTPAYIVQVALLVPALARLGVPLEAAHLFVLYFAILSAITPPVALAVYAANGISRAGLWDTSFAAVKLGATGYIIPYMFVFGPSLLMIGEWSMVALTVVTALLGVTALAASLHGFLIRKALLLERLALFGAAIILIRPGLITDGVGLALLAAVVTSQVLFKPAGTEPPRPKEVAPGVAARLVRGEVPQTPPPGGGPQLPP